MREHAEALRPPRSLWVPFMLGRPLGAPNDPAFQRRVVVAALKLFERETGPVLEDFPEEAPPAGEAEATLDACPVSFSQLAADLSLREQVYSEISQLRVWHDLGMRTRGRTVTGVAGAPLEVLVDTIAQWIDGERTCAFRSDIRPVDALRLACDELKAFYSEARLAQPGSVTGVDIERWFWHETAAGAFLHALHAVVLTSADPLERHFGINNLVPRHVRLGAPGSKNLEEHS